jgi:transposase
MKGRLRVKLSPNLSTETEIAMKTTQTALHQEFSAQSKALYISFELSKNGWKLALSDGDCDRIKNKRVASYDFDALGGLVDWAKDYFGLADDFEIFSVYEAGLDGFWIHHSLTDIGFQNIVVDPASIEVNQRKRRRKTDRLDAMRLVRHLVRYHGGDSRVWSVCQVPTRQDEDDRRVERELYRLKCEQTGHINRIKGLLSTFGIPFAKIDRKFLERIDELTGKGGQTLDGQLKREIVRQYRRLELVWADIKAVEKDRQALIDEREGDEKIEKVKTLEMLRGIGEDSAWLITMEMFGWRTFDNRGQVGAYAGLAPSPFNTGQSERDQGICKSGNKWVRSRMIQLAWLWLQYQPKSQLTQWFHSKYGESSKRSKRVGIVALARKLLVRLWKFVEYGEVPNGARLKLN